MATAQAFLPKGAIQQGYNWAASKVGLPQAGTQAGNWASTKASFYGNNDGFNGKPTANGETFDTNKLTAAINPEVRKAQGLKYGDTIEVRSGGKSVQVRLNDAGPFVKGRGLDLSVAAARQLGIIDQGVADVQFRKVTPGANPSVPTTSPSSVGAKVAALSTQSAAKDAEQAAREAKQAQEKRQQEAKERQDLIAKANAAVDQTQLDSLAAIADNSKDLQVKAAVDERRVQLNLKQKLADLSASGYPSPQSATIEKNLRTEAAEKIKGIREKLSKDLDEEAKTQKDEAQKLAAERKEAAEKARQDALDRANTLLDAQYDVSQSEINLMKAQAEASGDFFEMYKAQLAEIGMDQDRALLDLDRRAQAKNLPADIVVKQRNSIVGLSNTRIQKAQQDYEKGESNRRAEVQTRIGERIRGAIAANYQRRDDRVNSEVAIAGSDLGLNLWGAATRAFAWGDVLPMKFLG